MYHTAIRESIDKLSAIHRQLYDLAVEKTDVIKTGEIAQLQKITLSEQKLMQQLNKAEEQRMLTAKSYAKANHLPENEVTITAILESVKDEAEKNALEQAAIDLSKYYSCFTGTGTIESVVNQTIPEIYQYVYGNDAPDTFIYELRKTIQGDKKRHVRFQSLKKEKNDEYISRIGNGQAGPFRSAICFIYYWQ
ncbi:flagellar protein FlgN [Virgibacillus sp. 179-BFC.A HS]|uniref:Flagellar protein FlgN n=1 Tax=Tigheibacillus jepli TaxID=3035914 RepID=A0ABU5CGG9_9BACI|nr:flagellar protein FlgN [Virgibacillus sp. 179-BFC.A HS]MDY0405086.1 flagellar protein FlgN [Virgibacillus sp. 179-BFC.A HS]